MGKLIPIVSPAHLGLQASSAPLNIGAMLPKSRLWGSLRILPCGGVAAIVIGCVWGKRPRVPRLIVCAAHTYGKKPRASLLHHSPILLIDTSLRITTTKKLCPLLLSAVTKHDQQPVLADRRSLACANFHQNFPIPLPSPHQHYNIPQTHTIDNSAKKAGISH